MYCSVCPYLSESTQMYSFAQIVLDALIVPIHAVLKEITGKLLLLFKFIIKNKKHKHKIRFFRSAHYSFSSTSEKDYR